MKSNSCVIMNLSQWSWILDSKFWNFDFEFWIPDSVFWTSNLKILNFWWSIIYRTKVEKKQTLISEKPKKVSKIYNFTRPKKYKKFSEAA